MATDVDSAGYIAFCPCMGRFGNQIEQFLGVLSFAKQLNRTLILPPFVEYPTTQSFAKMVDFETIFDIKEIEKYHRIISMSRFMRELAPTIWPNEKRIAFCWSPRKSIYDESAKPSCNAKEGNPFGPFWDYNGIKFISDEYYSQKIEAGHDLGRRFARKEWNKK